MSYLRIERKGPNSQQKHSSGTPFGTTQKEVIVCSNEPLFSGLSRPTRSSQCVISPETDNAAATEAHYNPPKTFQEALHMLLTAWKTAYEDGLKFPTELIAFFPTDKAPLVAPGHQESSK
jgi:hypothetical protein